MEGFPKNKWQLVMHQTGDVYESLGYKEARRRHVRDGLVPPTVLVQIYDGNPAVTVGYGELLNRVNLESLNGNPLARRFDRAYAMVKTSDDVYVSIIRPAMKPSDGSLGDYGKDRESLAYETALPIIKTLEGLNLPVALVRNDFVRYRSDGKPYKVGSSELDMTDGTVHLCSMVYCDGFPSDFVKRVFNLDEMELEALRRNVPLNAVNPTVGKDVFIDALGRLLDMRPAAPDEVEIENARRIAQNELRDPNFIYEHGKKPGKVCHASF